MNKQIAIVGLGKMGANVARRLRKKGWRVVGWNRTVSVTQDLHKECGVEVASSFADMASKIEVTPRVIFSILPAHVMDDMLPQIAQQLELGDIIIDAANSNYKDTIRRHQELEKQGIAYFDVGFSGGPAGALNGGCLMVGGTQELYDYCEEALVDMAAKAGVQFFPGIGAGHFVKTVHNGIEYGMMQAIAEGFDIMHRSPFDLDLLQACRIYQHDSVITSRLIGWMQSAYAKYGRDLSEISGSAGQGGGIGGRVANKGEAVWSVEAAAELGTTAVVIDSSVKAREISREKPNYQGKVVQALRSEFGGHGTK